MTLRAALALLFLLPAWSQESLPSLTIPKREISPKIVKKTMPSAFAADRCSIRLQEMKLPEAQGAMTIIKPKEKTAPMPNLQVPAPSCAKADVPSDLVIRRP